VISTRGGYRPLTLPSAATSHARLVVVATVNMSLIAVGLIAVGLIAAL
jgi:hypothetical protein